MKEKLSLLLNKGSDDDALIDALKRELMATKQQQQLQQHPSSSSRVTSAGRDKGAAGAVGGGAAPSAQLTSALKTDLAKVCRTSLWFGTCVMSVSLLFFLSFAVFSWRNLFPVSICCQHSPHHPYPSIPSPSSPLPLSPASPQAMERAAKAEAQVERQHKIVIALKGTSDHQHHCHLHHHRHHQAKYSSSNNLARHLMRNFRFSPFSRRTPPPPLPPTPSNIQRANF
jgi:hypothetical protein